MILVDTGPIVAVVNDRDDHHQQCQDLLEPLTGPLLVPVTVATEVCLLLERRRGTHAELAFLADVRARRYTLTESLSLDADRVAELVDTYDNLPLGTVDASVIAAAERLKLDSVVPRRRAAVQTFDTRHSRGSGGCRPRPRSRAARR